MNWQNRACSHSPLIFAQVGLLRKRCSLNYSTYNPWNDTSHAVARILITAWSTVNEPETLRAITAQLPVLVFSLVNQDAYRPHKAISPYISSLGHT
ncbi:MAG: hypothetical protein VX435_11050 [Planctomycetota bacterium]|nr:hypothetical protein [Planctomycetota bacterium]